MEENVLLEEKISFITVVPHIILLFVFIGFVTIWKPLIYYLTTKFKVTDKRVERRTGFLTIKTTDVPLEHITSVKVEQNILGRIFHYGTLNINTASEIYEIKYIRKPDNVMKTIDMARQSKTNCPMM